MALFRKDEPGSAPGHIWEEAGQVVEVLDERLAADLRKMVHAGFHEVFPTIEKVDEAAEAEARKAEEEAKAAAAKAEAEAKKAAAKAEADAKKAVGGTPDGK